MCGNVHEWVPAAEVIAHPSLPSHSCIRCRFKKNKSGFLIYVILVLPYFILPKTSSHLHFKRYVLETRAPNHTMLCYTSFLCTNCPLVRLMAWKPGISLMVDTRWPVATPFDTKKVRDLVVII